MLTSIVEQKQSDQYLMCIIRDSNNNCDHNFYLWLTFYLARRILCIYQREVKQRETEKTREREIKRKGGKKRNGGEEKGRERERKRKGEKQIERHREKERQRKTRIESIYRQDYNDKITNVYRFLTYTSIFSCQTKLKNDVCQRMDHHHRTDHHSLGWHSGAIPTSIFDSFFFIAILLINKANIKLIITTQSFEQLICCVSSFTNHYQNHVLPKDLGI